MANNPNRKKCPCGSGGKVSMWDNKCGYCRTPDEQSAYLKRYGIGVKQP